MRRWPDFKQILGNPFALAKGKETASWNIIVDHYHPIALLPRSEIGLFLPHIHTTGLHLGVFALHSLFLYSDMPPPCSPLPPIGSRNVEPNLRINTLAILSQSFFLLTPPMKLEQTECSEMSAYKIEVPGYHPKERIQHSEHCENLKSRTTGFLILNCPYKHNRFCFPNTTFSSNLHLIFLVLTMKSYLNLCFMVLFSEFVF